MLIGENVSRETQNRLEIFVELVRKWNPVINLVSKSTLDQIWDRHIADSAQLYGLATGSALKFVDVGSGGGFPGIVLAILSSGEKADHVFQLVESDQRKATFLREVSRVLALPVEVHSVRIEGLRVQNADFLTARALAPLAKLLSFASLHLKSTGTCLFPKGSNYKSELVEALKIFSFDYDLIPSQTDTTGMILKISGLKNA
ncbi:16S rRNA (guanine(527)-N(7))-methyltransferase RsmG [Pseudorhodobacter turbinis]|uniref:Ribosomal RNA small subunit methyltransferase G n=1 Tax=Pseudorhodobacter turbinis TaxID=2500533 RepID=A0A4P8EG80_9RHOB|nr:16S rRNA (guanine(527)-N(7))-methyltransferase RsmG [Pseudorhodobacter turbinis]QCO55799.1 16S rRNA (guanine(527)-N(7))-methyltransferase RsmG [Pseudorhodobacter turbinis]